VRYRRRFRYGMLTEKKLAHGWRDPPSRRSIAFTAES